MFKWLPGAKFSDICTQIETRTPGFWDTPRHPMITHTSDSHQIPSHNTTKSKLPILKICQKFKFWKFARNFTRDTPSEGAWYDV